MKKSFILIFLLLTGCFISSPGPASAKVFRLGFPQKQTAPVYQLLITALDGKGLTVGSNLEIVTIDLSHHQTATEKDNIRHQIAEKCDLFFTPGDNLEVIYEVNISTPLLFLALTDQQHRLPLSMQKNTTGFYRGTRKDTLQKSINLLPKKMRRKIGMLSYHGAKINSLYPKYKKICAALGTELTLKTYSDTGNIGLVMREFKREGTSGVIIFPPAIRPGDLPTLIKWQKRLKIPLIGQTRPHILKGVLGGPTIDTRILAPNLADYAAKILKGRNPGKLPVKFFSPEYIVNLNTASALGIDIPREVIEQAEIVGLKQASGVKKYHPNIPLVEGSYGIGAPINIGKIIFKEALQLLAHRGYVENKNLKITWFDLSKISTPEELDKLAKTLNRDTDLIYSTGNTLRTLVGIKKLNRPICFIDTKETTSSIPDSKKKMSTGIVRSSFASIIKKVHILMNGASKICILGRSKTKLPKLINLYKRIAHKQGITISSRTFSSTEDIGPIMQEIQQNNDFILLFPPALTHEDVSEIVKWQNKLKFPVLSQLQNHIEAGLLGGTIVDSHKVTPKIAEYFTKILQGRDPSKLPYYYYPNKYMINLRAVNILGQNIPTEVSAQAEIIR